ncbi:MAG TPA: HD domain-containing phosphohydrolase [Syntrophomonadaceae bacterium]|nr:HD domain-containing phosphohydrolase [Syntrophomonadaceae bacterium]
MRRVVIEQLRPGMVIGRTIVGYSGKALLAKDTMLNELYISRLAKLGIGSVYVKDGLGDVDIPEIITQEVLSSVSNKLSTTIKVFSANQVLAVDVLKKSVNLLLDNLLANRNMLVQLDEIRTYSDYLFTHSINVAVLSIMTGLALGYMERNLAELGLGALLHDIGMIAIDASIVANSEALSAMEEEKILEHPEIGFNILRTYDEISKTAAHIAFQHHENVDGTGYPRQLHGFGIIEYARIVAVADAFDALIADRPERKGCNTTEALMTIKNQIDCRFDPVIVEAFASNIAMYPIGSLVCLNTGQIGLVTSLTKINSDHPVITVVCDENGKLISPVHEINLTQSREVSIEKRLSDEETDRIRVQIQNHNLQS